ncbi:uncharacterized protein LOC126663778 [Mercurialis annua]|uniref:uncharacterized protein LOC126663778 n=1 Tax=Mercurialis annua TaxID=3986 RepID=UPI00215DF90D|nr:uncharacterized protein LOC126663778 [Mercurialis annua]
MVGISCEQQNSWVCSRNQKLNLDQQHNNHVDVEEAEEIWQKLNQTKPNLTTTTNSFNSSSRSNSRKKKNQVLLEGYVEAANEEDDLKRTKSLTDDDLDELKGCLDLGFGFSYDEIPELCNTLPALELCYSMSQKFLDEQHKSPDRMSNNSSPAALSEPASSPIASWKISSPGDHPEDVKARLKYWAQAVACTVRLCS